MRSERQACSATARVATLVCLVALAGQEIAALGAKPKTTVGQLKTTVGRAQSVAPKSCVELFDPKSNTEVALLGCLHGSLSSSIDVRTLLTEETQIRDEEPTSALQDEPTTQSFPDAVVLELCEGRYRGLLASREEMVEEYGNQDFWDDLKGYWNRTFQNNKNPLVSLVKVVLGTTSLLQTNLSGIRAGLEFEVAMEMVEARNNQTNNDDEKVRLVLADRDIDETMERIGSLPFVSLQMIRGDEEANIPPFFSSIPQDSNRLSTSVWGDSSLPPHSQISMPKVLLRSPQAQKDLGRLLLIPSVVATLVALITTWFARGLEPDPYDVLLWEALFSSETLETRLSAFAAVGGNALVDLTALLMGYVLLALPAARVIVSERDDVLTESILETVVEANGASSSSVATGLLQKISPPPRKRIVAVLGLLHVNGVAKQLLACGFTPSKSGHNVPS